MLAAAVLLYAGNLLRLRTAPRAMSHPYEREFLTMGSYGRLLLWAPADTAQPAADAMVHRLARLERTINIFKSDSELSRLNQTAAEKPFKCSRELWRILEAARRAYAETDGAFDVTVGPLMQLWGFHAKHESWPAPEAIAAARARVGLNRVRFDERTRSVQFSQDGMSLDVGGLAKGYALDLAIDIARRYGITAGLIDLGGNLACLGTPPPGESAYIVGVRDPFQRDRLASTIEVLGACVATSGDYEHAVTLSGRRVCHIMDARTGVPVAGVAAVTVVTPRGIDSDVYSTAIFVAGESLARRFVATHRGSRVLITPTARATLPEPAPPAWISE